MQHVWYTLIFLHLEASKFLIENVCLRTVYCLGALKLFLQLLSSLMSHLNVLDLLKCPLINSIMNGTKSNANVLKEHFFIRGGIFQTLYLSHGLHYLPHLSID
jgi:hypothetical protein